MKLDEKVIYNGVEMRRDYAESLQKAQTLTRYVASKVSARRIPFGSEIYPMFTPGDGLCPCCNAARGQLHEPLCEREQCPVCKCQVMSCDCDFMTDNAVPD